MTHEDKYGTKAIQKELLTLMKLVHAFFETKGIRYSLCGGSLLGAIRHNGFIPWDDDIDIMMDRENFEKFLSVKSGVKDFLVIRSLWVYRIKSLKDKKACIDIFVFDKCPQNTFLQGVKILFVRMLQGMMKPKVDISKYSFRNKILIVTTYLIGKPFPEPFLYWLYDKISQLGNGDEGSLYNDLYKCISFRFLGKTMDDLFIHKFEDADFSITKHYDLYLKISYGNYMTPPNEKDRNPIHI